MRGCEVFIKNRFKDTYQKLLLDNNLQGFTTINNVKGLFIYAFGLKIVSEKIPKGDLKHNQ